MSKSADARIKKVFRRLQLPETKAAMDARLTASLVKDARVHREFLRRSKENAHLRRFG